MIVTSDDGNDDDVDVDEDNNENELLQWVQTATS